jgi:hypothetical protein
MREVLPRAEGRIAIVGAGFLRPGNGDPRQASGHLGFHLITAKARARAPLGQSGHDDDAGWRAELVKRYSSVTGFLPSLAALEFGAVQAQLSVLAALRVLPALVGRRRWSRWGDETPDDGGPIAALAVDFGHSQP